MSLESHTNQVDVLTKTIRPVSFPLGRIKNTPSIMPPIISLLRLERCETLSDSKELEESSFGLANRMQI